MGSYLLFLSGGGKIVCRQMWCVCVCERERERETHTHTQRITEAPQEIQRKKKCKPLQKKIVHTRKLL